MPLTLSQMQQLDAPKMRGQGTMLVKCPVCGATYKTCPSRIKAGYKTCSYKCQSIRRSKPKLISNVEFDDPENGVIIKFPTGGHSIFDKEDAEKYSHFPMFIHERYGKAYVKISFKDKQPVMIHHVILGACKNGLVRDHINGNSLDNRKRNLRFVTQKQNRMNCGKKKRVTSSKYKGVFWNNRQKKWLACVELDKKKYTSSHSNEIDAANAYDKKAKELFGDFAYLNFKKENK